MAVRRAWLRTVILFFGKKPTKKSGACNIYINAYENIKDDYNRLRRIIFICFALSIKGRSKPCVLKHFKGALEAGVTVKELSYIFTLTMREAAGADDCWTHDVIGEWQDIIAGNISCECRR